MGSVGTTAEAGRGAGGGAFSLRLEVADESPFLLRISDAFAMIQRRTTSKSQSDPVVFFDRGLERTRTGIPSGLDSVLTPPSSIVSACMLLLTTIPGSLSLLSIVTKDGDGVFLETWGTGRIMPPTDHSSFCPLPVTIELFSCRRG